MSDLIRRLARLSPERRAAFLRGLGADTTESGPRLERGPRAAVGDWPLSLQQEQLWILDQTFPGQSMYNVATRVALRGALDRSALERALHRLERRHEVLRTHIVDKDGIPVQRVVEEARVLLDTEDLSALAGHEQERSLDALCARRANEPFDLGRAPLARACLIRLAADHHELLWITHHVVCDGWSVTLWLGELRAAYLAETGGPALPEPSAPRYVDYAQWQRTWLEGPQADGARRRARAALEGAEPLSLPTDRAPGSQRTFEGAVEVVPMDRAPLSDVDAFARAQGVPTLAVFTAAFQAVLHRWTGQEDLVIGSAVANRNQSPTRSTIGCFTNVLPLRGSLRGDQAFADVVAAAASAVLDALEWQDLPLAEVVEAVRPPRPADRLPLVQATLTLQSAAGLAAVDDPSEDDGRGALCFELRPQPNGGARFELAVEIGTNPDGTYLLAEYNTGLFDTDTIRTLLGAVETLLADGMAEPERTIGDLPLMSATEQRRVTREWNRTAVPRRPATLDAAFAEQAARTPDAVALESHGRELTYRELDAWSDRLARSIRAHGVGPEDLVGVCVNRSNARIAAVLGVLKAGAAYVPVEPEHPTERNHSLLANAGVCAVVADAEHHGRFDGVGPVIGPEDEPGDRAFPAPRPARPDNAAYVLFTSGSTGAPKGVAVSHANVSQFIATVREMFSLDEADVIPQFAALTFDVSVFEIFGTLLSGGRLVMCGEQDRRDPHRLTDLLARSGATVVDLPPAVMALLEPEELPRLRVAFVGGEAFPGGLASRWAATGCAFYNGYGTTENTVTTIAKRVVGAWHASPPIGRAMANHRAYVLDSRMRPVPVGMPGELYVGGSGTARGYLGRPGLTAERFLPDPFAPGPGERVYRTGDLARWRSDGDLEYLGRLDRQVQISGQRVELGEIESVLAGLPGVRQAVVEPDDSSHTTRLTAYLSGDTADDGQEARRRLAELLPGYMVPHAFMWLDRVPLTPSGKVDRSALPSPEAPQQGRSPATPTERRLVEEVVGPLLGQAVLDTEADLFELGVTSMQTMRILVRVRSVFGVRISPGEVYLRPTVARIAALIDEERDRSAQSPTFADLVTELSALPPEEALRRLDEPGEH
ncbi:amino acid adenylation domain-containing protein [Nocardiopsis sp. Huas11]|uniref:non-ribosomal peptide synthetase n=1 Tax=Nocardiopsis sp. Huas11 TaxID=2183912 RepID=UPI000EAE30B6|nr:non-ribosomal peptide synthetase [Nocardiopsis sp. Huas11]RKS08429.1 amino acid adenylation domain-containing protein [Nocardiopsis sp. Huas11]